MKTPRLPTVYWSASKDALRYGLLVIAFGRVDTLTGIATSAESRRLDTCRHSRLCYFGPALAAGRLERLQSAASPSEGSTGQGGDNTPLGGARATRSNNGLVYRLKY